VLCYVSLLVVVVVERGSGIGEGDKQQLDALLLKRWMAGNAGSAGVSASGDSSSKLARLAHAEVGAKPVLCVACSDLSSAAAVMQHCCCCCCCCAVQWPKLFQLHYHITC
jgi:hypothetical protein